WYLKPSGGTGPIQSLGALVPIGAFATLTLWFSVAQSPWPTATWYGLELPHAGGRTIAATIWVLMIAILGWVLRNRGIFGRLERIAPALYMDTLYDRLIIAPVLRLGNFCNQVDRLVIDRIVHGFAYGTVISSRIIGWLDRVVVDGVITLIAESIRSCGTLLRKLAAGDVRGYLWWAAAGLVVLLTCLP
ncbi:MAG: hypothetical protein ACKOYP_12180, partial [Bacteroidota bacterium]